MTTLDSTSILQKFYLSQDIAGYDMGGLSGLAQKKMKCHTNVLLKIEFGQTVVCPLSQLIIIPVLFLLCNVLLSRREYFKLKTLFYKMKLQPALTPAAAVFF